MESIARRNSTDCTVPDVDADPVRWAANRLDVCGIESPRLEAQLLLAHALNTTRTAVVAGIHRDPSDSDRARFYDLVNRRCSRTPLAYLRGAQEFYGLEFEVNPGVLIPRPETEMLVEFALEYLHSKGKLGRSSQEPNSLTIADVGTGSGCIAVSILANCADARAVATDLSAEALETARRNAEKHNVQNRLKFVHGDLLAGAAHNSIDLILSNPPYIPTRDLEALQPEVRDAEPRLALDGGPDGLSAYRLLAAQSLNCLKHGGSIAVEVGQGQAAHVACVLNEAGLTEISVRRDIADIERVVIASR